MKMIDLSIKDSLEYLSTYSSQIDDNVLNNAILIDDEKKIIWIKYNGVDKNYNDSEWYIINNSLAIIQVNNIWNYPFSIIIWLDKKGIKIQPLWNYSQERNNEILSIMKNILWI